MTSLEAYLKGRLYNWKFYSAQSVADEIPNLSDKMRWDIKVLAQRFGDSGWFEGDDSVLVQGLVDELIDELEGASHT